MALLLNQEVGAWLRPQPLPAFTTSQVREMLRDDIRHWQMYPFGPWVLIDRESGALVGRGGLQSTVVEGEPVVELPWTIAPDRWSSGLATEAARAAIEWARSLELGEVVTMTLPENRASRRVAEKAGLRFAGEIEYRGLTHVLYRLPLTKVK
jgi:[ribosomal protein S5]-alanine N-acetyltransferase